MKKFLLSFGMAALALGASAQETVYFFEDFEWINPWAVAGNNGTPAGNTIGDNDINAQCPNLTQCKVDGVTLYNAFLEKGYVFLATHSDKDKSDKDVSARTPDKQIYVNQNYLKFGLTNYFSGVTFPAMETLGDGTTDIKVSFDWCPMKQGNGTYDTTILVIVVKNEGQEELQFPVMPLEIADGADFKWYHTEVPLTHATLTKDTRLTIRNLDPQWPAQAITGTNYAYRYFLDNVKVFSGEESAVAEIAANENTPVEYFNLQGVRVANPENGLYIVKQGSKVEKRIIR